MQGLKVYVSLFILFSLLSQELLALAVNSELEAPAVQADVKLEVRTPQTAAQCRASCKRQYDHDHNANSYNQCMTMCAQIHKRSVPDWDNGPIEKREDIALEARTPQTAAQCRASCKRQYDHDHNANSYNQCMIMCAQIH